jgi:hypothetical protein
VFYGIEDPLIQHVELCPGFEEHQGLVDATTAGILSGEVVLAPAVTGG